MVECYPTYSRKRPPAKETKQESYRPNKDVGNEGIATKSCLTFRLRGSRNKRLPSDETTSALLASASEDRNFRRKHRSSNNDNFTINSSSSNDSRAAPSSSSNVGGIVRPSSYAYQGSGGNETHQITGGYGSLPPSDASASHQQQQQDNNNTTNPLLSLPKPTDRSHKRRVQYENDVRAKQQIRGVYEGEIEPEGVRGQEASVAMFRENLLPASPSSNFVPKMRMFGDSSSATTKTTISLPSAPVTSTSSATASSSVNEPQQHERHSAGLRSSRLETIEETQSIGSGSGVAVGAGVNTGAGSAGIVGNTHVAGLNVSSSSARVTKPHSSYSSTIPSVQSADGESLFSDDDIAHIMSDISDDLSNIKNLKKVSSNASSASQFTQPVTESPYSSSTDSSVELQNMMADLVPSEQSVDGTGWPEPLEAQHHEQATSPTKTSSPQRPQPQPQSQSQSHSQSTFSSNPAFKQAQAQAQAQSQAQAQARDQGQETLQAHPQGEPYNPTKPRSQGEQNPHLEPQQQQQQQQEQEQQQQSQQPNFKPYQRQTQTQIPLQSQSQSQSPQSSHHVTFSKPATMQSGQRQLPHSPETQKDEPSAATESPQYGISPSSSSESPNASADVDAINSKALQYVQSGEYDMALGAFAQVLAIYKKRYGELHPMVASAYHNLGTVHAKRASLLFDDTLHQRHCRAQSLHCFQLAARSARDSLGRDHPNVAVSLVRIGFLLLQARQYNNAVITFQEALRIRQAHYGMKHGLVANLYNNLGVCYMHLARFSQGRELLDHALEIQRSIIKEMSGTETDVRTNLLELADTLFNIGGLCLEWIRRQGPDARHVADAEVAFTESLKLRESVLGPRDPVVLQVRSLLDMAKSIPRPKTLSPKQSSLYSPKRSAQAAYSPSRVNNRASAGVGPSVVNNGIPPSEPSQGVRTLPSSSGFSSARGTNDTSSVGVSSSGGNSASSPLRQVSLSSANSNATSPKKSMLQPEAVTPTRSPQGTNASSESQGHLVIETPTFQNQGSPIQGSLSKNQDQTSAPMPDSRLALPTLVSPESPQRFSPSRSKYSPNSPKPAVVPRPQSVVSSSASTVKAGVSSATAVSLIERMSPDRSRMLGTGASSTRISIENSTNHVPLSQPRETAVKDLSTMLKESSLSSQLQKQLQQPIFRPEVTSNSHNDDENMASQQPPLIEVTVSNDESEWREAIRQQGRQPPVERSKIFISPHYVPEMSPDKVNLMDSSSQPGLTRSSASASSEFEPPSPSAEMRDKTAAIPKQYSYDAEESLMINDSGVGSDQVNYSWSGKMESVLSSDTSEPGSRKIMVVRPYRDPANSKSADNKSLDDVRNGVNEKEGMGLPPRTYSDRTTSLNDAISHGTPSNGNDEKSGLSERESILARAKAVLSAHDDFMDSPSLKLSQDRSYTQSSPERKGDTTNNDQNQKTIGVNTKNGVLSRTYDHDIEDGVAPLGLSWPERSPSSDETDQLETFHVHMLNDPEQHLRAIYEEASLNLKKHKFTEALDLFGVVLQVQRRKHGPLHEDVAAALHNVGIAHLRNGNHHEALKAFQEATRVRKGALGKDHPQVAASLVKVGITCLLLHRFEEALLSFREALSVRKHALGTLHPSTARIYNNIGCVHVEFNEFREARRAFEAALDIQRNALCHDPESGPIRFGTATTLCNIGYLYRSRKMHDRAVLVLKEAVDIQENILGKMHPTVLSTLDSLAEACSNSGQGGAALNYYEQILERFREKESNNTTDEHTSGSQRYRRAESVVLYKMSQVCQQRRDREGQLDKLQNALKAFRSVDKTTNGVSPSEKEQAAELEKQILADLREVREELEKQQRI